MRIARRSNKPMMPASAMPCASTASTLPFSRAPNFTTSTNALSCCAGLPEARAKVACPEARAPPASFGLARAGTETSSRPFSLAFSEGAFVRCARKVCLRDVSGGRIRRRACGGGFARRGFRKGLFGSPRPWLPGSLREKRRRCREKCDCASLERRKTRTIALFPASGAFSSALDSHNRTFLRTRCQKLVLEGLGAGKLAGNTIGSKRLFSASGISELGDWLGR